MNQELETLIEKLEGLREAAKRAHLEDKAIGLDIAVQLIKGRLAELDPRRAAEIRLQDMKHPTKIDLEDQDYHGPRKLVEVQTDDNGVTGMRRSKAPRWLRHAVRYIFFLILTFVSWIFLVDWLAGDGGTTVAGRIIAAFFGFVALLIVSAYITEFNQTHD